MVSSFIHLTRVDRGTTWNEECDTLCIYIYQDTDTKEPINILPWLCPRRHTGFSLALSSFVSWGQERANDVGTLALDMARCATSYWANENSHWCRHISISVAQSGFVSCNQWHQHIGVWHGPVCKFLLGQIKQPIMGQWCRHIGISLAQSGFVSCGPVKGQWHRHTGFSLAQSGFVSCGPVKGQWCQHIGISLAQSGFVSWGQ